jgi:hypothetical protein
VGILSKSTTVEPVTPIELAETAATLGLGAVNAFTSAIDDLDAAANLAEEASRQLDVQIDELLAAQQDADSIAFDCRAQASALRTLITPAS